MRLLLAPLLAILIPLGACDPDEETPPCTSIAVAPHNCSEKGCIDDAWSSDKGEYGAPCKLAADCGSGLCATDPTSDQHYCTQTCETAAVAAPCPRGAGCFAAEGEALHLCGPPLTPLSGAADDLCQ
jgi:hypothetical protein